MIYVINEHLKYDPLSATLYSPEYHSDTLVLTRVNNSILLQFVNNNNQLLTRHHLLKEVWENQGLDSSNNNLNNHISILRKSLAKCGCDDIIKTIPKKGLMFTANSVTSLAREVETPTSQEQLTLIKPNSLTPLSPRETPQAVPFLKITAFLVLILIIVGFPNFYENMNLSSFREEVLRVDQCRFYVTDNDTKSLSKEYIKARIEDYLTLKKFSCDKLKSNVYFFYSEIRDAMGRDTINQIISYCPYNSSAQCINYKEQDFK